MQKEELDEIIRKARNQANQNVLSEEDINNLLNTIDENANEYLENNTTEKMLTEIVTILEENNIENVQDVSSKLLNYRYVDELHLIHKGKNIKYINTNNNKFYNGGLVLDTKFLNNGTHILCKGYNNIKQIKFDESIIFQQLTSEELFILMSNDLIINKN